jgi:hypothetical protein
MEMLGVYATIGETHLLERSIDFLMFLLEEGVYVA